MTNQPAANRSQAAVMGDTAVEVTLSIRAEHAEGPGPLWDAATARLWWVDITRQRVHCFDPAMGLTEPSVRLSTTLNGPERTADTQQLEAPVADGLAVTAALLAAAGPTAGSGQPAGPVSEQPQIDCPLNGL